MSGAAGADAGRGADAAQAVQSDPPLAGGSIAAQFGLGEVCEGDGWCWYNPLPSGTEWHQMWASSDSDLWIAGRAAFMLHSNGYVWTTVSWPASDLGGTTVEIDSLWGAAADDLWAGGIGGVIHWDGRSWTVAYRVGAADDVTALWGAAANDIYAAVVGSTPLLHWDGQRWAPVSLPGQVSTTGKTLWGTARDDVYLGTSDGIWHFDGAAWTKAAGVEGYVDALWASARDDVWASLLLAGTRTVRHFDGSSWTVSYAFADTGSFLPTAIAGTSSHDVWVVGGDFTQISSGGRLRGFVLHWDGSGWAGSSPVPSLIYGAFARAPGFITVEAANGQLWNVQAVAGGPPSGLALTGGVGRDLLAVWGAAPNDVWIVGSRGTILHWNGEGLASFAGVTSADLDAVWGAGRNDVWGAGSGGTILHWDGTAWSPVSSGVSANLRAVWASGANDVWVAGDAATVLHWTGAGFVRVSLAGWTAEDGTPVAVNSISGTASDDVWIAGGVFAGLVSHYDGIAFGPPVHPGAAVSFSTIRATSRTDVWAQEGDRYFDTYHFDGNGWAAVRGARYAPSGRALWAAGPADVWIVGTTGGAHFDGATWTGPILNASGAVDNAWALFGFGPQDDLWAVGLNGLIIRRAPRAPAPGER